MKRFALLIAVSPGSWPAVAEAPLRSLPRFHNRKSTPCIRFGIRHPRNGTRTRRPSSPSAPRGRAVASVEQHLLVLREGIEPPAGFDGQIVKAPVRHVVCMSSSHVAMFDAIGQAKRISGVSGIDYISNAYVREHRRCGEVLDVGYDTNLNFERLAARHPDLMLLYGVTGENTIVTGKLRELGIPYICIGDYMEESPLGKAEWLMVAAELCNVRARVPTLSADRRTLQRAQRPAAAGQRPFPPQSDAQHPLPRHLVPAFIAQLHDPPDRGCRRGVRLHEERFGHVRGRRHGGGLPAGLAAETWINVGPATPWRN